MREVPKKNISHEINDRLLEIKNQSFSGSLKIESGDGLSWTLNFRLGRLGWVTGGNNVQERWQRHLDLYCSSSTEPEVKKITSEYSPNQECNLLLKLQGQRSITRQELSMLMAGVVQEVLFDIIQYIHLHDQKLDYQLNSNDPKSKISLLLPLLEFKPNLIEATIAWEKWNNAGLAAYSPNLFPVIKQPEILQTQTSSSSFSSITSLIDGTLSLRNLAIKSNCNLVSLTEYLVSMADIGAIFFSQVPTSSQVKFSSPSQKKNIQASSKKPLVVCVDDSPLICQALEKIILKHGYRFISIQEPTKVILTILKHKPDFIFLDLLMPIVNGYELCTQLRRTPKLQDVPITILTAKDGLVDRMRAKLAGSTDFMSKPVEEELVIAMLNKHLTIGR